MWNKSAKAQPTKTCNKPRCSENNASILSRSLFSWVTPLITYGWSSSIEADSLPKIGIGSELAPSAISARFQSEWTYEKHRASTGYGRHKSKVVWFATSCNNLVHSIKCCFYRKPKNEPVYRSGYNTTPSSLPSLVASLYPLVSGYLFRALIARLVAELVPVFLPILVKITTTYAQHRRSAIKHSNTAPFNAGPPTWQGYTLATSMFLMLLLYSWSFQWFFFEVGKATIVARSALISAVYRKSLVLSSEAKARITMGRLTNLVSSDISQIERGITNIIVCFTIPIQALASIAVLVYMLGPVTIAGWALIVTLVPVQMWATRYLAVLRAKAIKYTDKRIVATREALQGIKTVKLFVWEGSILETIRRAREKELALIARLNIARYGLITFALHSPVFASVVTFAVLVVTGHRLEYGPVFAVIGIFNSMSVPLSWLPGALTEARNSTVPLTRIKEMLLEDELDSKILPQPGLGVALRIDNGRFVWKTPATTDGHFENEDAHALPNTRHIDKTLQAYRFPPAPGGPKPHGSTADFDTFYVGDIEIPHGCLVAVVGAVGSGKSSLLSALLGEMRLVSGSIALGGTVSYAPQVPWVMNASIRDNITFGIPFDRQKYINVVEACSLEADLQSMPDRDLTEVGERGVTLSGGQKQRINIARAVYAESDMVLLDDCLSAVDVKTSHEIFKHCIKGLLASKTRIVATNNLDLLSAADIVITVENNRVVEHGSPSQLMAIDGITAGIYRSFVDSTSEGKRQSLEDHHTEDSSFRTATPIRNTSFPSIDSRLSAYDKTKAPTEIYSSLFPADTDSSQGSSSGSEKGECSETGEGGSWIFPKDGDERATMAGRATDGLMSQEERATGQVAIATYVNYVKAGGGYTLFVGIVLSLLIAQGCRVGSDFWMRSWVRHRKEKDSMHLYIGIYALLGAMQLVWFVFFAALLVATVYKSSKKLHSQAMQRVLHAPMNFFDTTPLGRVLNRFTRDIDSLDLALCDCFRQFYQNISRSIGSFVSISILVPIFLAPLVPLFAMSWVLIYIYMHTSVELQRVAAIARSPLYAHYTQTLQGLATIRAYEAQGRYISIADKVLDSANRPQWLAIAAQNWVWLRVDILSHILSFIVSIVVVSHPAKWDAAAVGLLLVQATQMGSYATYAGRGWTELQNNMNSVERIEHYATSLEQEESSQTPDKASSIGNEPASVSSIPQHWPRRGTVIIRELTMCYRQGLSPALRNINMEIYDGDRVAIVGRSGAGKSSIISALFRISEPSCGRIFIDGIDTQTLALGKLRRSIGILPQDPVLFDGTLRDNLDPLHEFADSDIWSALDLVCLRSKVAQRPEKLDVFVGEGGDSFSVGQRQLICLARALLRKPRILVLDEATANVDHETDSTIQHIILSKDNKMTVISIAHRLQTIIKYDKVFVVDDGQIIESGSPLHLLEQHLEPQTFDTENGSAAADDGFSSRQEPSVFHDMIKEMGSDAVDRMLARIRTSRASVQAEKE